MVVRHAPEPATWIESFTCVGCGYGIAVAAEPLPECPMCRETSWVPERSERRDDE